MPEARLGDEPSPDATYRVAHTACPKGNRSLQIRDRLGRLYPTQQLAHLVASEGRPALAPARLALVTGRQCIAARSDRQAAAHVRDASPGSICSA